MNDATRKRLDEAATSATKAILLPHLYELPTSAHKQEHECAVTTIIVAIAPLIEDLAAKLEASTAAMEVTGKAINVLGIKLLEAERDALKARLDWKPKERIVLVWDGEQWYVRTLDTSEHDGVRDRMIYYCERPVVNDQKTVGDAIEAVRRAEEGK